MKLSLFCSAYVTGKGQVGSAEGHMPTSSTSLASPCLSNALTRPGLCLNTLPAPLLNLPLLFLPPPPPASFLFQSSRFSLTSGPLHGLFFCLESSFPSFLPGGFLPTLLVTSNTTLLRPSFSQCSLGQSFSKFLEYRINFSKLPDHRRSIFL